MKKKVATLALVFQRNRYKFIRPKHGFHLLRWAHRISASHQQLKTKPQGTRRKGVLAGAGKDKTYLDKQRKRKKYFTRVYLAEPSKKRRKTSI